MIRAGRAKAAMSVAGFLWLSLAMSMPVAAQTAPSPSSASKVKSVVILPFATPDLSREEAWIGEAMAQSIMTAFRQVPGLIQVDRSRLKALTQPETWDESSAVTAARAVHADHVIIGEVRRNGGEQKIQ